MKQTITLLLLFCGLFSFAQESSERKVVDAFMNGFNLKMDTVYWLYEYDNIAWWTSDSVYATPKEEQAKLGSEWFCFKRDNVWHAVYGKYQDNKFDMVYHYEVDTNQLIKRVYTQIDTLS